MVDDVAVLAVVGRDNPYPVEALGQVGEHPGYAVAYPVVARADDDWNHKDPTVSRGTIMRMVMTASKGLIAKRITAMTIMVEALHDELRKPVLQELLKVFDVARHAAHQHPGLLAGVEVETKALEVREDADTQVVHHSGGKASRDLHHEPLGCRRHPYGEQVQEGNFDYHGHVRVDHAVVYAVGDQRGPQLVHDADDHHEHQSEQPETPVPQNQEPKSEPLLFLRGGSIGEMDVGLPVDRLLRQKQVHPLLHLHGTPAKGSPLPGYLRCCRPRTHPPQERPSPSSDVLVFHGIVALEVLRLGQHLGVQRRVARSSVWVPSATTLPLIDQHHPRRPS